MRLERAEVAAADAVDDEASVRSGDASQRIWSVSSFDVVFATERRTPNGVSSATAAGAETTLTSTARGAGSFLHRVALQVATLAHRAAPRHLHAPEGADRLERRRRPRHVSRNMYCCMSPGRR